MDSAFGARSRFFAEHSFTFRTFNHSHYYSFLISIHFSTTYHIQHLLSTSNSVASLCIRICENTRQSFQQWFREDITEVMFH
jgi:hypothetical protein